MQQTPTDRPVRHIHRSALGIVGTVVLVAGVVAGGESAFAVGGDTTLSQVDSDFQAGATSIVLDGDINDSTSTAATLTLSPNTSSTATTTLDLNGHTLAVKALQLTTFDSSGSALGSSLRIVDTSSSGGGVLRVAQASGARPAIEVDASSSLAVLSGSVIATNSTSSSAAVVGGGPVANPIQTSGSITTNGSGSLAATGSGSGAAIGSGSGAIASGTLAFGGSSHVSATTAGSGAALGDGNGAAGASILIANQAQVSASQNGSGSTGAAIGGGASPTGQTAGSVTIGDDAQLTAVSTGAGAAVGGGYHGDGGTITATGYAHITANGAQAAIGDGEHSTGGGSSVSLSGQGVVVDAHGGTGSSGGAGIGGGSTAYGNDSLAVGGGATLSASSDNGPGIGGLGNTVGMSVSIGNATVTATGGSGGAGIGAGSPTSIGTGLSIADGAVVSAAGGLTAIGGSTAGRFGTASNAGVLTIPSTTTQVVPSGATLSSSGTYINRGTTTVNGSFSNSGAVTNSGTFNGGGSLDNTGSIVQNGTLSTAGVTGNAFNVVYDGQGGSKSASSQLVYADTIAAASQSIATATPPSTGTFTGWNTSADGTGTALSATSSLSAVGGGSAAGSPFRVNVYALYQIAPVLPSSSTLAQAVVGTAYSASVAATAGTSPIGYQKASGDLPAGLSLNSASGAITGTPTTAGTFTMTVQAQNTFSASHQYTIQVVPAPITLAVPTTSKGTSWYLAGSSASLKIGGLQANETYSVSIGGKTVATGKAASNSAFTLKVTVPKSIGDGSQTVRVSGGVHATAATATILTASVAKALKVKLSAKKVKAKKAITITISKLYAGESVRVVIKGKHGKTAVGKATSKGVYVLKLKTGLAKGKYTVTVTGAGTSRKATTKLTVS